jgi:hypothetical protein
MTYGIRPIETRFNGQLYRSRHEARWAVFLTTLGEPFHYEAEGFELLPIGMADPQQTPSHVFCDAPLFYVPDFWLPRVKQWIEIKPDLGTWGYDDLTVEKARRLAVHSGYAVIIVCGNPGLSDGSTGDAYKAYVPDDCDYLWCVCGHCGAVGLQYGGRSERLLCCDSNQKDHGGKRYAYDLPRLRGAFDAATRHRFFLENADVLFHRNHRG